MRRASPDCSRAAGAGRITSSRSATPVRVASRCSPPAPPSTTTTCPTARVAAYLQEWTHRYHYVLIAAQSIREGALATRLAEAATGLLIVVGHEAQEHDLVELRRHASVQDVAIIGFAFAGGKRARQAAPGPQLTTPPPAVVKELPVPTTRRQRSR